MMIVLWISCLFQETDVKLKQNQISAVLLLLHTRLRPVLLPGPHQVLDLLWKVQVHVLAPAWAVLAILIQASLRIMPHGRLVMLLQALVQGSNMLQTFFWQLHKMKLWLIQEGVSLNPSTVRISSSSSNWGITVYRYTIQSMTTPLKTFKAFKVLILRVFYNSRLQSPTP